MIQLAPTGRRVLGLNGRVAWWKPYLETLSGRLHEIRRCSSEEYLFHCSNTADPVEKRQSIVLRCLLSWQEGELRGWKRQRKAERVSREVKANHGHMERGRKGMWRKISELSKQIDWHRGYHGCLVLSGHRFCPQSFPPWPRKWVVPRFCCGVALWALE